MCAPDFAAVEVENLAMKDGQVTTETPSLEEDFVAFEVIVLMVTAGVLKQVVLLPPKTASHHITIDPLVVVKAPTGPPVNEVFVIDEE